MLIAIVSMVTMSCRNELEKPVNQAALPEKKLTAEEFDRHTVEFAKILAKALTDENVAGLIKEEAAKQFDQDFDVLYQMIKDKEVRPGVTFSDQLASLAQSENSYEEIVAALPLLTIFVPDVNGFSADRWDVKTQVPLVAVITSKHDEVKNTKIESFDHKGQTVILDSKVKPNVPVVVVKMNERVVARDKGQSGRKDTQGLGSLVHQNETNSFYFAHEGLGERVDNNSSARLGSAASFDTRVKYAFNNNSPCHRDYVYYDILPAQGKNSGPLNENYAEHLTAIGFQSVDWENHTVDDIANDWTDGTLEFSLTIFFNFNQTSVSTLTKGFTCGTKSLFTYDSNGNPTSTAGLFTLPQPLKLITWDLQAYGDRWKFKLIELDPPSVTTTTETISVASTYGSNFTWSVGLNEDVKIGGEFNGSSTRTVTNTTTYQVNGSSDDLFEDVLTFCTPVILWKTGITSVFYGSHNISTGAVYMSIEPKYVF